MNTKVLIYAVLLIITTLSPTFTIRGDEKPEVGIVENLGATIPPELTFTDSTGASVQLKNLINKPTVLSMVYFHCPTVCKPLLGSKTDVLSRIDLIAGKDYDLLTISFNPNETPEHAKAIKDHFLQVSKKPVPPGAWTFLTGDQETILKLTNTLGFYFKADGEDFIHPTGLIMISPKGKITRYFNGLSFLPFDVKLGLIEASEGKIGPTISRVLLYCFSYDPEGQRYVFNILKVTATVTIFFMVLFIGWLIIITRKKKKEEK